MSGTEKTYRIGEQHLACKVWGDGRACVALHGWLDNAGSFDLLAPALAGSQVFAVDLPGHGLSSHRPGGVAYHFIDYVNDIVHLVSHLDLDEFDLLGHSMGGGISALVAAALPDRVRSLVLLDSVGPMTTESHEAVDQFRKSLSFQAPSRTGRLYDSKESAITARVVGGMPVSRNAAEILCKRGLKSDDGQFSWRADPRLLAPSLVRLTESQVGAFVKAIESPVCLVMAKNGIQHYYPEATQHRMGYFSRAQIHQLPGGHHFHLEPEVSAIADIIQAFLQN